MFPFASDTQRRITVSVSVTRYSTGTAGAGKFGQVDMWLTELFGDRTFDLGDTPPLIDSNPFSKKAAATMVLHGRGDATSSSRCKTKATYYLE